MKDMPVVMKAPIQAPIQAGKAMVKQSHRRRAILISLTTMRASSRVVRLATQVRRKKPSKQLCLEPKKTLQRLGQTFPVPMRRPTVLFSQALLSLSVLSSTSSSKLSTLAPSLAMPIKFQKRTCTRSRERKRGRPRHPLPHPRHPHRVQQVL